MLRSRIEQLLYSSKSAIDPESLSSESQTDRLQFLRTNGFVILENFIDKETLHDLQAGLKKTIEQDLNFEYPVLAQTKIDSQKNKEQIDHFFRYSPEQLAELKLTFSRNDVAGYEQILRDYRPSTLKVSLPDHINFWRLWLHSEIQELVEAYMGLRPTLLEAYIRRNFPADFRVMNHYWHRDRNHPDHLLKAFFFFTDCELENGPHEYISKSVKDRRLDGRPYFEDHEVDALYPVDSDHRIRSIVKAGTVILEDTRGLHRAMVPQAGYRDLGYAVFLPVAPQHIGSVDHYKIPSRIYRKLSRWQRRYIPGRFVD